eukprot:8841480-Alexandrium_andersonii.AAC.1
MTAVARTSTSAETPTAAQSASAAHGRLSMTQAALGREKATRSVAPVIVIAPPPMAQLPPPTPPTLPGP